MAKRTVPLRPHVQDALSVWGQLIRRGRIDRAWTAKDLAARANVSEQTVLSAEAGHRGTAVGTMMDLGDLVGVPIFGSKTAPNSRSVGGAARRCSLSSRAVFGDPRQACSAGARVGDVRPQQGRRSGHHRSSRVGDPRQLG